MYGWYCLCKKINRNVELVKLGVWCSWFGCDESNVKVEFGWIGGSCWYYDIECVEIVIVIVLDFSVDFGEICVVEDVVLYGDGKWRVEFVFFFFVYK